MENSHRKISLLSLIASRNYIPRVICANDASNQSCAIYSREICRVPETVNPIGGVSIKNLGRLMTDNEITSWSGGIRPMKRRKVISGNSSVVRYSSVTKVTSNTRTLIYWRNYFHVRQITVWTLAPVWWENIHGYMSVDIICSKMRRFPRKSSIWLLNAYWLCGQIFKP